MAPTKRPSVGFRLTDRWLQKHLPDALSLHGLEVSEYSRHLLTEDVRRWLHSPYIGLTARHLLYVTAEGRFIYQRRESLRLNTYMKHIPAGIEMKHAKIRAFLDGCQEPSTVTDFLRSRWKSVTFTLWGRAEERLAQLTDDKGITAKSVALPCNRPGGTVVERETHAVLDDYVQWQDEHHDRETEYDSMELDITIPIQDLQICVVIDENLYRSTRVERRPVFPSSNVLQFRLQTTEGQQLMSQPGDDVIDELSSCVPWNHEQHTPSSTGEPSSATRDEAAPDRRKRKSKRKTDEPKTEMRDHAAALAFMHEEWRRAERSFQVSGFEIPALPERCFFHQLWGTRMTPGLRLSIQWPRPDRPRPE